MSSEPSRQLILLRHGKSAYPPGVPDHARPLADRGLRQSAFAGEHIRTLVEHIDLVLCSTSTRTRQTLDATGLATGSAVEYREEIYAAEAHEILQVIVEVSDSVRTLLVVGHFPGVADLADDLAGPGSDQDARDRVRQKFPTSAFAVLAVRGAWSDLPGTGRLVNFTVPRDHPQSIPEEKR